MLTMLSRCECWPSCIPGRAFDVLCSTQMRAELRREPSVQALVTSRGTISYFPQSLAPV